MTEKSKLLSKISCLTVSSLIMIQTYKISTGKIYNSNTTEPYQFIVKKTKTFTVKKVKIEVTSTPVTETVNMKWKVHLLPE